MSTYYNGGISLTVGGTSVTNISSYSVSTHLNKNGGSPVSFKDFSITTGAVTEATAHALLANANAADAQVALVSPDFTGDVYVTSVSSELLNANIYGRYYRVSLSLSQDADSASLAHTLTITAGETSITATSYTGSWDGQGIFTASCESELLASGADLMALHATSPVSVVCPDFEGNMYVTSVSNAFDGGTGKYRVSLSLSTQSPEGEININGISVGLTSYEAEWNYERESFEMYDYSMYTIEKGRRCTISYTTVPVTSSVANDLVRGFNSSPVTSVGPDYSGSMFVNSVSKSAQNRLDENGGTMYVFSVSCTSVATDA